MLAALDPELFKACFSTWVESLRETEPDLVAIDGKTSRRTHDRGRGREPLHLVSAWATRQRLVLGQEAASAKSSEITAIPLLLERLALAGALVTIDAIGAQSIIAEAILRHGKSSRERRYYLGSARLDAATFAHAVRGHWGIENRLHWLLDVVLRDDLARLRTGHGPANMAVVKHMAINLLRQAGPTSSLENRRQRAGWNNAYLESLIRQNA